MNKKLFLKSLVLSTLALGAVACSSDEPAAVTGNVVDAVSATYVYSLELQCAAPTFDGAVSRATTWEEGSKVYLLLFKDDVKQPGTAVYSNGGWQIETKEELTPISESRVNAMYIENPLYVDADLVLTNTSSALYFGKGTYSVADGKVTASVSLAPQNWRMRFAGEKNTQVTVESDEGHLKYFSAFFPEDFGAGGENISIDLTVGADGYTPYIYGIFKNASGDNTIKVTTNGKSYTRTLSGTSLIGGQSGYLTLPTAANAMGWIEQLGPNPYLVMDYYKDLGLTLDEVKALYGKPDMDMPDYRCVYYKPTTNTEIVQYIVFNYDATGLVWDIVLLLHNEDARIVEAFNEMYHLNKQDDTQYEWVDNADKPTMTIFYVPKLKAIEYALIPGNDDNKNDINIDREDYSSEDIDLGAILRAVGRDNGRTGKRDYRFALDGIL